MEQEHPTLDFHCPATQEHITLAFGYLHGEPMMPIFKGEPQAEGIADLVTMIPREVLIQALKEGWGGAESGSTDVMENCGSCDQQGINEHCIEHHDLAQGTIYAKCQEGCQEDK